MGFEDDQKAYGNIEVKEGWLDLRLGNPVFLQKWWDNESIINNFFKNREIMEYSKQRGERFLTSRIAELHEAVGNVERPWDSEIVVGNGSSQVLAAAMWAFKKRGVTIVSAEEPHWPRF
jgi:aspartate/methionine/tyrosine aminotransferase